MPADDGTRGGAARDLGVAAVLGLGRHGRRSSRPVASPRTVRCLLRPGARPLTRPAVTSSPAAQHGAAGRATYRPRSWRSARSPIHPTGLGGERGLQHQGHRRPRGGLLRRGPVAGGPRGPPAHPSGPWSGRRLLHLCSSGITDTRELADHAGVVFFTAVERARSAAPGTGARPGPEVAAEGRRLRGLLLQLGDRCSSAATCPALPSTPRPLVGGGGLLASGERRRRQQRQSRNDHSVHLTPPSTHVVASR
jgi:hypothetical protein